MARQSLTAKGKEHDRSRLNEEDEEDAGDRQTRAAQAVLTETNAFSKRAAQARARDEEDLEEEEGDADGEGDEVEGEEDSDNDTFEPGGLTVDPEDYDPEEEMRERLATQYAEMQALKLALEESRTAHDALLRQQQLVTGATPGASSSRSARASATTTGRTRAAPPPANSPSPPASTRTRDPAAHSDDISPIVGVGAPRFIPFPEKKTEQTMAKIRAGLGAMGRGVWLEINDAVRQSMARARLQYDRHWLRQNSSTLALLYPIIEKRVPGLSNFENRWATSRLVQTKFNHRRGRMLELRREEEEAQLAATAFAEDKDGDMDLDAPGLQHFAKSPSPAEPSEGEPEPKPRRTTTSSSQMPHPKANRPPAESSRSNDVSLGLPADFALAHPTPFTQKSRPAQPTAAPTPQAKRPAEDDTISWGDAAPDYDVSSLPPPTKKHRTAQLDSSHGAAALAADSNRPAPPKPKPSAKDKGKGKAHPPTAPNGATTNPVPTPTKLKAPTQTKASTKTKANTNVAAAAASATTNNPAIETNSALNVHPQGEPVAEQSPKRVRPRIIKVIPPRSSPPPDAVLAGFATPADTPNSSAPNVNQVENDHGGDNTSVPQPNGKPDPPADPALRRRSLRASRKAAAATKQTAAARQTQQGTLPNSSGQGPQPKKKKQTGKGKGRETEKEDEPLSGGLEPESDDAHASDDGLHSPEDM